MDRLKFFACLAAVIGLALCAQYFGLAWTLGGVAAVLVAWFGAKVYFVHLDYVAAEVAFYNLVEIMVAGGEGRKAKRIERREDVSVQHRAVIGALMAPAARYGGIGPAPAGAATIAGQHAPHAVLPAGQYPFAESDSSYPYFEVNGDRLLRRERSVPQINIQVIHEDSPNVDFSKSSDWMCNINEEDRKKAATRKQRVRQNALVMATLFIAGPSAARREIVAINLAMRRKDPKSEPPLIPHLEYLSQCNRAVVFLALRLFDHSSIALLEPMRKAPSRMVWRADI